MAPGPGRSVGYPPLARSDSTARGSSSSRSWRRSLIGPSCSPGSARMVRVGPPSGGHVPMNLFGLNG
eukprot:1148561-Pyramimonas_sp.AAC.1